VKRNKIVIEPNVSWALEWKELLSNLELLYFFSWRNFKIRYKQTVIGASWAIIRPFILMVVFTLFFNRALNVETGNTDVPYPVFSYAGLLFWNYFAQTTNQVGTSLVSYQGVINKVYFPRLIVPISTAVTGLIDFFLAFLIYVGILIYYSITPDALGILLFIPALIITFLTVVGVGSFMAALNVRYRDVAQALPFGIQVLLFLTPVIYPVGAIPEQFQWILYLNPITGVIESVRNGMLGLGDMQWGYYAISVGACITFLTIGFALFKRQERAIGDYI
jgi:lipopolysaccharide transport system permease protein